MYSCKWLTELSIQLLLIKISWIPSSPSTDQHQFSFNNIPRTTEAGGFSPPKSQAKNKNLKINKNSQWRRYFQRGRQFVIKVQQRHGCNHPCCSIKYISSAHFGVPLCCFQDILSKAQDLKTVERQLINNVIVVCKLVHINPATSVTGEKSFSTATWIKIGLPLRM